MDQDGPNSQDTEDLAVSYEHGVTPPNAVPEEVIEIKVIGSKALRRIRDLGTGPGSGTDGDGDGLTDDGTRWERPATPRRMANPDTRRIWTQASDAIYARRKRRTSEAIARYRTKIKDAPRRYTKQDFIDLLKGADDQGTNHKELRDLAQFIFEHDLPNYRTSHVDSVRIVDADTDQPKLIVSGRIFDGPVEDDEPVGEFDRVLSPFNGGNWRWPLKKSGVIHERFILTDPEEREKGIGSAFIAASEAMYSELGLEEISVTTGMSDGAVVWAKDGFDWDSDNSRGLWLEALIRAAEDLDPDGYSEIKELMNEALDEDIDDPERIMPIHVVSMPDFDELWQAAGWPDWRGKRAVRNYALASKIEEETSRMESERDAATQYERPATPRGLAPRQMRIWTQYADDLVARRKSRARSAIARYREKMDSATAHYNKDDLLELLKSAENDPATQREIKRVARFVFEHDFPSGHLTRVDSVSVFDADTDHPRLEVEGSIYEEDFDSDSFDGGPGTKIGEFSRSILPAGNPEGFSSLLAKPGVIHEFLEIEDIDSRGIGIGSAFIAASEAMYSEMGLELIKVTAGMTDGPTVWALDGFDWVTDTQRSAHLGRLRRAIEVTRSNGMAAADDYGDIEDVINAALDEDFDDPERLRPIHIATMEDFQELSRIANNPGWTGIRDVRNYARQAAIQDAQVEAERSREQQIQDARRAREEIQEIVDDLKKQIPESAQKSAVLFTQEVTEVKTISTKALRRIRDIGKGPGSGKDGDGDGMTDDGTQYERPAAPAVLTPEISERWSTAYNQALARRTNAAKERVARMRKSGRQYRKEPYLDEINRVAQMQDKDAARKLAEGIFNHSSIGKDGAYSSIVKTIDFDEDETTLGVNEIGIGGDIVDRRNGRIVGSFSRIFVPNKTFAYAEGKSGVYHDTLVLDDIVRGEGIARDFLLESEIQYSLAGFEAIGLRAGLESGPWIWARDNYDWASEVDRESHLSAVLRVVNMMAQNNQMSRDLARAYRDIFRQALNEVFSDLERLRPVHLAYMPEFGKVQEAAKNSNTPRYRFGWDGARPVRPYRDMVMEEEE